MYDHYIALDWAEKNMAIARMTAQSNELKEFEGPSDIAGLKEYLSSLQGTKILTIEESTGSQWLYTELEPCVDKLIICDPYRNRLLSEGPKTDRIDARKLVKLLKANMLKEVFHSGDEFIYYRKIVSGYDDLVKSGVRLKNQKSALFRAVGKNGKKDASLEHSAEKFVLEGLDNSIKAYEIEKVRYEKEFCRISKNPSIKVLKSLPGIAEINAVKIAARIVDPRRFETSGKFLSYCGLIKHDRISGGRSYGKKNPRYCRTLKGVFKMATSTAIQDNRNNPIKDCYEYFLKEKNCAQHDARNATSRRLAVLAFGVFKSGKNFDPYRREKCKQN